jgi:hypothetical protein
MGQQHQDFYGRHAAVLNFVPRAAYGVLRKTLNAER